MTSPSSLLATYFPSTATYFPSTFTPQALEPEPAAPEQSYKDLLIQEIKKKAPGHHWEIKGFEPHTVLTTTADFKGRVSKKNDLFTDKRTWVLFTCVNVHSAYATATRFSILQTNDPMFLEGLKDQKTSYLVHAVASHFLTLPPTISTLSQRAQSVFLSLDPQLRHLILQFGAPSNKNFTPLGSGAFANVFLMGGKTVVRLLEPLNHLCTYPAHLLSNCTPDVFRQFLKQYLPNSHHASCKLNLPPHIGSEFLQAFLCTDPATVLVYYVVKKMNPKNPDKADWLILSSQEILDTIEKHRLPSFPPEIIELHATFSKHHPGTQDLTHVWDNYHSRRTTRLKQLLKDHHFKHLDPFIKIIESLLPLSEAPWKYSFTDTQILIIDIWETRLVIGRFDIQKCLSSPSIQYTIAKNTQTNQWDTITRHKVAPQDYRYTADAYITHSPRPSQSRQELPSIPAPGVPHLIKIAANGALSLNGLHREGIAHRDIKPANFLLIPPLDVRMIDFGFATNITREILRMPCGSPLYMPPEVLLNKGLTTLDQLKQADIFSMFLLYMKLLTGKESLFQARNLQELQRCITQYCTDCKNSKPSEVLQGPFPSILAQIPAELRNDFLTIVDHTGHPDPDKRWNIYQLTRNMFEFSEKLNKILSSTGNPDPSPISPEQPEPPPPTDCYRDIFEQAETSIQRAIEIFPATSILKAMSFMIITYSCYHLFKIIIRRSITNHHEMKRF